MKSHHKILCVVCTMIWCTQYSLGQVSLEAPTNVRESEGSVEVCAVLDMAQNVTVTARIFTEDLQTLAQEDYVGINETLTFTPPETQMCVDITIIQDGILDELSREGFYVRLQSTELGVSDFTLINIQDTDRVTIGFQQSPQMTTEGQPAMVCVQILSGQSARQIDFGLESLSDGSAVSATDYHPRRKPRLKLTPGQPECVNFTTFVDDVIEAEEFFLVTLTALDPIDVAESQVTVFIEDDDGAVVSLERTEIIVPEGNGSMTMEVSVCVVLFDDLGGLEREVQVLLETVPVEAGERDYEPLANATLSIPSSTMQGESVCRNVTIIGDDAQESDETFMVTISLVNPLDSVMGPDTVTVTIEDDGDVLADCGVLNDPVYGTVSLTGTTEGSTAMYTCNSGFELIGDSMRDCGPDGQWSPTEPTCEQAPSAPRNVMAFSTSSMTVNVSWDEPEDLNGVLRGYEITYYRTDDGEHASQSEMVGADSSSVELMNLDIYTNYTLFVRARTIDLGDESERVTVITDEDAPSAPRNVMAFSTSSMTVNVSWDEPEDLNGVLRGYEITYYRTDEGEQDSQSEIVGANSSRVELMDLDIYTNYTIFVRARTIDLGDESERVTVITNEDTPSAPRNAMAFSTSSMTVNVSWDEPEDLNGVLRGYEITYYRTEVGEQDSQSEMVGADYSRVQLMNLDIYTNYTIFVRARTIDLGDESERITVITNEDIPSAPVGFSAFDVNPSTINASWSVPAMTNGNIIHYNLSYSEEVNLQFQTPQYTLVAAVEGVERYSELITNLTPFTRYRLWVTAATQIGESEPSVSVIVETDPDSPSSPTSVTVSVLSATAIEVSWGYPELPRGIIQGYILLHNATQDGEEIATNVTLIMEDDMTQQSHVFNNLLPFTYYRIQVSAYSSDRNDTSVIHLGEFSDPQVVRTNESEPSAPLNFELLRVNGSPLVLNARWRQPNPTNGVIITYTVYCRILNPQTDEEQPPNEQNGFIPCNTTSGSDDEVSSLLITNLIPFTYYNCYVTAATIVGEGNASNSDTARTDEDAPSDAPRGFTVVDTRPYSITVEWTKPSTPNGFITSYTIQYSSDATDEMVQDLDNTTLSFTAVDLNEHTSYTFKVFASTRIGPGPAAVLNVTTTQDDPPGSTPLNFEITVEGPRNLTFSWEPPVESLQNVVNIGYKLSCSPQPDGLLRTFNHSEFNGDGRIEVRLSGFTPSTIYSCSVLAFTRAGNGPAANATVTTEDDSLIFQLQLSGVHNCPEWAVDMTHSKLQDIRSAVQQNVEERCLCGLPDQNILEDVFQCFSDSTEVTFRARLVGTASTSALELASYLWQWIAVGASINVQGLGLMVDSTCMPLVITSISDAECGTFTAEPSPTQVVHAQSSDNSAVVIGGVVATISALVAVISVTIVVITVLVLKNRRAERLNLQRQHTETEKEREAELMEVPKYGDDIKSTSPCEFENVNYQTPKYCTMGYTPGPFAKGDGELAVEDHIYDYIA